MVSKNHYRVTYGLAGIGFISILNVWFLVSYFYGPNYLMEMACGWSLTFFFSLIGIVLKNQAIGKDVRQFFTFSLGFNFIKTALFCSLIFLILWKGQLKPNPFVCAVFVSYVTFMIYDVLKLHLVSCRSMNFEK